jgi:carboxypeptidase Taq
MNAAYAKARRIFSRIGRLEQASAFLQWDQATMMPEGGAEDRAEQLATLAGLSHDLLTAPETAAALAEAEAGTDPWEQANLALMRHRLRRASAVPRDLVEAEARAAAACEKRWRAARRERRFALAAESLAALLGLVRERAAALADALGLSPYDALMDGFQPGLLEADLAPLFAAYRRFLPSALAAIEARPRPLPFPSGPYPQSAQAALCLEAAAGVGLDFRRARFDTSLHPFCGGTPNDVRLTTRYDEADFSRALLAVLHESGHALYEQGLPQPYLDQPVGQAAGMAVHESQSLFIEMQLARNDAFLRHFAPKIGEAFPAQAASLDPETLGRHWRRVERSLIRVDADEVTYPAHVILRYELEKALLSGELPVADLPGAWNEGMMRLLGVSPAHDGEGCLQDIHWYEGAFGYFPSYTVGAILAAQLMAALRAEGIEVEAHLESGEIAPIRDWLRRRIHGEGSRLSFAALVRSATGRPLDFAPFREHLCRRYALPEAP